MIVELTVEERSRLVDGYDHLHAILRRLLLFEGEIGMEREHFWVIGFQNLDCIKYVELVALGEFNTVAVLPREAYRMAVHQGCNRVIIAHNHPNGQLRFTKRDTTVTRRMIEAGEILGIDMLDHLLVSIDGWKSYLKYRSGSPFQKRDLL
jgi:DNA repair protein RadC